MLEVRAEDLHFSYVPGNEIIGGIDMHVNAGDFVCLLGQSGCGKSTLLRLIAGLEKPTSGMLTVDGKPIKKPGLERGVVFQDYGLFPWMSAGENLMIALKHRFPDMTKDDRKETSMSWLKKVGLNEEIFDKFPKEISGGQKQRCAVARAFAIDAPILLMDEPFAALDAITKAKLQNMVLELWASEGKETRKTIFFVTHQVDEAVLLATDIYVLSQSPATVLYRHKFEEGEKPKREDMYTDPSISALMNKLVQLINQDAVGRIETSN